jgi:hypothetical protein
MRSLITALIDRPTRFIGSLIEPHLSYTARKQWEIPALLAVLIVAGIVRFWGVGSFGLHKPDEDTSALPAVHVLQDGTPRFPSGMFYARAIVQSYLIAGSVKVFGQSEWALRLPSVLTGIALVLLAYYLGRRFLEAPWNIAFVAVVALLPGMIADSQEVRMYIFLSACLAAYMILVFRWERTGQVGALVGAVVAILLGIQFQEIAIFSSLLLLFPGLAHGDSKKLIQGLIALVFTAVGFKAISLWIGSFYPEVIKHTLPNASPLGEAPSSGNLHSDLRILAPAIIAAMVLAWFNVRTMSVRGLAVIAAVLLFAGFLSQALLQYHLGAIFMITGLVIARRSGGARAPALALLLVASAVLAVAHLMLLHGAHVGPWRKILGVMVGKPSIWPYLQVAGYSPIAMLLVAGGLCVMTARLASGGRVRDDILFAFLGVFVPLFGIGFFSWYIPPRYGEFALLPMLLCAMSVAQYFVNAQRRAANATPQYKVAALAGIVCLAVVNPIAVAHSINGGSRFPDHKQAAEYIRSIKPGDHDIIIAEEVLMQTYYLGRVDYWLTGESNAASYVLARHGQLVDEYTNTPVIDTAAELRALIDRPNRGDIYVIGSGENQIDGRLFLRGPEISQVMQGPEFRTVYLAPDGLTRIWKISAPSARASDRG